MVVVADTSPVNYLVLIDQIEILARLYKRILIPPAVLDELKHPVAPGRVRHWATHPPGWLEVVMPKSVDPLRNSTLEKARRLLLRRRCKSKCCSSMSTQDGKKRYDVD